MVTATRRGCRSGIVVRLALGLCVTGSAFATSVIAAQDQAVSDGQALPEVTVIGKMDARAVNRAVAKFIQSHAQPSAVIGQIGRWTKQVCPAVTGLQDAYGAFISRSITSLARSVGAPVPAAAGKCTANIEVVFTPEPQALLGSIAKKYRWLLGYSPTSQAREIATFTHPAQAWYMTGTVREQDGYQRPHCISSPAAPCNAAAPEYSADMPPFFTGTQIDSNPSLAAGGPIGTAGSYLTHDMRSEFVHVLIIVDSGSAAKYSLQTISDYIAMLALTRIASLDTCSELPSIVNLFATDCAAPPAAVTMTDMAYLKALYGANLDKNLNIEEGDIHVHMLDAISRK